MSLQKLCLEVKRKERRGSYSLCVDCESDEIYIAPIDRRHLRAEVRFWPPRFLARTF